jgi:5-methyltetrahydropteroyltriglutamate--homocysteine methyltransferase
MLRIGYADISTRAYPEADELNCFLQEPCSLSCYRKEIKALYNAGCRYIQLDETSLALMCDPNFLTLKNLDYKFDESLHHYIVSI